MLREIEIKVAPEKKDDDAFLIRFISQTLGIKKDRIKKINLVKRSVDARGSTPLFVLRYEVHIDEIEASNAKEAFLSFQQLEANQKRVVIVGAGPAGYFAALECIHLGLKPIVIDRGKDVQSRRRDLRAIQQFGKVNPNSNYCFGEGGAGTYSDGKLYTRSYKRGSIQKVLQILVAHGAKSDIQVDTHPHIGSNKLPQIVAHLRDSIIKYGGEVHFETRMLDFIVDQDSIKGIITEKGEEITGSAVLLATGHSARDVFDICAKHKMNLEFKPFALGVRVEHPQALVDEIQYNMRDRGPHLPASSYQLACQVDDMGVFSFCMCPGGLIVPTATSPGELVVNGMSLSKRDSPFANAGTVVSINESNIPGFTDVFSGLRFQENLEQSFFKNGDGSQKAPAQRLTDFLSRKISADLPPSSYIPGLYAADFKELLPQFIYEGLRKAVVQFDKRLKGYLTAEAQMIGLESRTSSPIKIIRDKGTYMSPSLKGLFPCGEGAGYAGGILSAAMDGQNVAAAIKKWLNE